MSAAKSYSISKLIVWEAFQRVKANRGAAGIDEQSIAQFEQKLQRNLYKVWNRMSSGSYFPPPVRQVEIPKQSGGKRKLGIPTVADRVAQTAVKLLIEPRLDCLFHSDSYGYRPGKSAKQAVEITRRRCWNMNWVVEFDIKGAFDHIDHELLLKAVRHHVKDVWILLYIERWLKAPFETADGVQVPRESGTPQGGIVSPLLMDLFMHYAFDAWIQRTFPGCPFARYADDAVVHCRSEKQACEVMAAIKARLEECLLTMHPEKSKIVYCKDSNRKAAYPTTQFTFLGFTFRPREAWGNKGRRFTSFLPGASNEAIKRMRQRTRSWNIQRQTPASLFELSTQYNAILRGWWNYYGAFYKTVMRKVFNHFDLKLQRWARRKYKPLAGRKRRSADWLNHDVLMAHVQRQVEDKRVLRLIRRYLEAGVMSGGIASRRQEGTPQGGPLSPLLSNILLNELDRELERRGHRFVRYADDANIYVRSQRAGERVMVSVERFLSQRLKLTLNREKSRVAGSWMCDYLGYGMSWH